MGEILTDADWSYILRCIDDEGCRNDIMIHLQTFQAERARVLHVDEDRKLGPFSEGAHNISRPIMRQIVEEYASAVSIRERRLELAEMKKATKAAVVGKRTSIVSAVIASVAAVAAWVSALS